MHPLWMQTSLNLIFFFLILFLNCARHVTAAVDAMTLRPGAKLDYSNQTMLRDETSAAFQSIFGMRTGARFYQLDESDRQPCSPFQSQLFFRLGPSMGSAKGAFVFLA